MSSFTQPLSNIVPVTVVVSPAGSPGPSFNQALIVGSSAVIPSVPGATNRLRAYTSLAQIAAAGFATNSPEYLGTQIYFSQTPAPVTIWLGRQNLTALQTVTIAVAGTGYTAGDIVAVTQSGASFGMVQILTAPSGIPGTAQVVSGSQGNGYSVASALATTGGTGSGFEVNITAVGETALQAVTACRSASPSWYACMVVTPGTVDADYLAIAAFIQGCSPPSFFFLTSGEAAILNNQTNNLFAELQALAYTRTWMQYSTTQGGAFPNNIYCSAAPMGVAMGHNTGAAGSYFDLMFKPMAGVAYEPLTTNQLLTITGSVDRSNIGLNGNVLVNYQNGAYIFIQNGTTPSGSFFDQTLFLDMLVSQIQTNAMNLLISVPALPITNAGIAQMAGVISQACVNLQSIGFIAPAGIWNGATVKPTGTAGISAGDSLPKGYSVLFPGANTLSAGQKTARQLPAYNVLLIEAQSAHSLTVVITVQQ